MKTKQVAESTPSTHDETENCPGAGKSVFGDQIEIVPLSELKSHPSSTAIYGTGCSEDLVESVRMNGVLQPLLVSKSEKLVIAGNSRAEAARRVGLEAVPVTWFESTNPLEIEAAVLDTNKQRVKTEEQKIREFNAWKRIEAERAKARMGKKSDTGEPVKIFSQDKKGKARDKAAAKIEKSGPTAEKGSAVVAVIDTLIKEEKVEEVEEFRKLLNERSIEAALRKAKERGYIVVKKKGTGSKKSKSAKKKPAQSEADTADVSSVPKISDKPDPERDDAHGDALTHADAALTFLRGKGSKDLTKQQRLDWGKVLGQIISALDVLGIKAA
jgi:ParB family chromosome partitioning protein